MTETFAITVQPRTTTGNNTRKLRRDGYIPGVIYGNNTSDVLIQIPYNDFVSLYKDAGRTHVVDVTIEGSTYHCLVHDIDVDPVKDTARHVDFLSVNLKKKVTVSVPLEFVGVSEAVVNGGVLNENLKEVEVEALPNKVPESITVDLSKLVTLQDNIHVSDLPTSSDYEYVTEPEVIVASVVEPQKEEEIAPAPPEGAAVQAADGATTAPTETPKAE